MTPGKQFLVKRVSNAYRIDFEFHVITEVVFEQGDTNALNGLALGRSER